MARYYFEIADAYPPIPCIGEDLASLAEARCYALKAAGEVLSNQLPAFWDQDEWVMTISDENRLTLCTITIVTMDAASTMRRSPQAYAPPAF